MKIVIFGLTVSSSWGNGHATLWRGLLRSLASRGHRAVFFERDVPYYASARDLQQGAGWELCLYPDWSGALSRAERELEDADVAIVTSYCPDARAATDLIASKNVLHVFYDLDTPVTLDCLDRGEEVEYLPHDGFARYDLVLSFTGGRALDALRTRLHAREAVPLYGSVDAEAHFPVAPRAEYQSDLSYLGTYAADRQDGVERLFVGAARACRDKRFVIGGAQYPAEFPWTDNIYFLQHVAPAEHPAFYCSSKLTLNVTRAAMANYGFCPSGRLFEAAACNTPMLSDTWEGIETFFEPGEELLLASTTDEAIEAMQRTPNELARIAENAKRRVLRDHTAEVRAMQMVEAFR